MLVGIEVCVLGEFVYDEVCGNELCLWVCDYGLGVFVGLVCIIFEKFMCGEKEFVIMGVGLGLVVCEVIVSVYYGCIWVEVLVDGGVCFVIVLFVVELLFVEDVELIV